MSQVFDVRHVTQGEELATTGMSYTRPDGTYADAANWVTTENSLREEHGYRRRVKY